MRLVIAAPHGRSGKSTFTLGLIAALRSRGLIIQPFKKGPDYIDPSWMTMAAGRQCRNLDLFFVSADMMINNFVSGASGADLAIVEGAMGLFDGLDLEGSDSTATIAKTLKSPVLLVVDTTRMTRSVAALVQGFASFDPDLTIGGVILNKVARPRHEDMLRRAIEEYTSVPVLGVLPQRPNLAIADRHLGLIPAGEMERISGLLTCLGDAVTENVDLDQVLALAQGVAPLPFTSQPVSSYSEPRVRIGVIRDHVFSFYYPENLEALERAGAELVFINSTIPGRLPDIDALYIGGGFPEVYARELEANTELRSSIRQAAASGLPIYAECGGLMYLARHLLHNGCSYEMVGALPCDTRMQKRPLGHGYSIINVDRPNFMFAPGTTIKGHEFHHSCVAADDNAIYYSSKVMRGYGCDGKRDGIVTGSIFASYCHIYAPACPEWAVNLTEAAYYYRQGYLAQGTV